MFGLPECMAREPSVLNTNDLDSTDDELPDSGSNSGLLHRRSYLKLAGSTTVAAALGSQTVGADEQEYEVIEANGQTIDIGDGETFENKLIDVSNGNSITIYPYGSSNVTIRNIGIKGIYRGDGFIISCADPDPSGENLIENVYIADGATKEGESFQHGPGAAFLHKDNEGQWTVRNCNVQGYPNNGWYFSNTASGGSVRFESCYGKNNGVTTYRIGSANDQIVDCVAYNDNTDYGSGYGGYSETNGRPVWVWEPGGAEIVDSHFAAGPYPSALVVDRGQGATMNGGAYSGNVQGNLQENDVGSDPVLEPPEGVPTSAEQAAGGGGSSAPSSGEDEPEEDEQAEESLENLLLFDGSDEDVTRYEFVVDGEIEKSNYDGATLDDEDAIEDGTAHGVVADWKDAFRFSGDLEELTVDGPATVYCNDEEIDPAEFGDELPHTLEIEGSGTPTSFEVTVDGTVELAGDADPENEVTAISGSTVQSSVTDDTQMFSFSGTLTDVSFTDGEAMVSLDGERIDITEYGDQELLPHALVIDGTDASGPSTYSFEIDGNVVESNYREATIDDEDVIDDGAVRGAVAGWLDAYWFEGDIQSLTVIGDASADIQYNARDQ